MPILREVVASFTVDVDKKPLTDLDFRIEAMKKNLTRVGTIAAVAFGAIGTAAYFTVGAASRAEEKLNVLRETFKGNTDAVLEWSRMLGAEVGRSEYTLQESAGSFGDFLGTTFKKSHIDIAMMSEKLAQLAVDLGSFYNISDEQAQMRLFSGLAGETEAVRRLGIDISDTSLDDLNKANGDRRRMASLTLEEKTALRLQKILLDTEKKVGDAARTSKEWANSLKRVQEQMKTAATNIGKHLMPMALSLLYRTEDGINKLAGAYKYLTQQTHSVEVAFGMAALALGRYVAAQIASISLGPWFLGMLVGQALAVGVLAAKWAALTAVFLVVEDFVGFMQGHQSVFGNFITETTEAQRPLAAFRDVMEDTATHTANAFIAMYNMSVFLPRLVANLAKGMNLFDATTAAGDMLQNMTHVGDMGRQREANRESDFQAAVQREDYKGALNFAPQHMDRQEAKQKALRARVDYVKANPEQATEQDFAVGLAPWAKTKPSMSMPMQNIAPTPKPGEAAGKGVVLNVAKIEITGVQDAEEAIQRLSRQAYRTAAAADNRAGQ